MKEKIRTAVLVSGGGTNLAALLGAADEGRLPHVDICLVISNKEDAYALTRAKQHSVQTAVFSKTEYAAAADRENAMRALLEKENIELIILAGFLSILSEDFVRHYDRRIINIHPSLIPSFCGAGYYGLRVHSAALERGVKITGATVHYVNEIPDGGEIIMQKSVSVRHGDTPETLQRRVMERAEWKILPAAAEKTACRILKEKKKRR